ncbi:MAG TPA: DUF2905 domain-containing protein [Halanaerobiaceae bacterium]|nr:DUF2905 domain-containing protein [Halanaerobiaceae bacterium]
MSPGKLLIYIGLFLVLIGGIIHYFGGALSWFGRLPGDIRIERENFRFYFPLTSMLLISLILNIVIRLIRFFLQ